MNDKDVRSEERFYRAVADIIGCADHEYRPYPFRKRTRWNTRQIGNGRFPGHGIVRRFSENMVHVSLTSPSVSGVFRTDAAALDAIRAACEKPR